MPTRVGNVARISVTFAQSGVVTDPGGTITYKAKAPDLSETTLTTAPGQSQNGIVREAAGVYHYDTALTAQGNWYFSFESAPGVGQSYDTTLVQVDPQLT